MCVTSAAFQLLMWMLNLLVPNTEDMEAECSSALRRNSAMLEPRQVSLGSDASGGDEPTSWPPPPSGDPEPDELDGVTFMVPGEGGGGAVGGACWLEYEFH